MDKIIKKDGYVILVLDYEKKGFETYCNLGKDIDDPRWKEEIEEKPKKLKNTKKEEE